MGIGAMILGGVAWLILAGSLLLPTPHELASLALMIALSGTAVAREGQSVEEHTSRAQLRVGFWTSASALIASAAIIVLEIARRLRG
jgi:hypothetical protein